MQREILWMVYLIYPCGEIDNNDLIELADGQTVLIRGEKKEIIC